MSDQLEPIIHKIERRSLAKLGTSVVAINTKTGKAILEAALVNMAIAQLFSEVVLYEVTPDVWVRINNANAPIAIFPTNERSDVTYRLRLKAVKENATRTAEALHHIERKPAEVVLSMIHDFLQARLEESSKQGRESAMERLTIHRLTWQAEVARVINSKLGLEAELVFELPPTTIDTDLPIRVEGAAVVPSDARHATFSVTLSVVLARAQARSNEPFLHSPAEQQQFIREVVVRAFRDNISLYTYWYQPNELQKRLTNALVEELGRYAYVLKSPIAIDPIQPPIPAQDVIKANVEWTGRLARPIPFHIEAKVNMLPSGAGLYHARKIDRASTIKEKMLPALTLAMHGHDFVDLTEEFETQVRRRVHQILNEHAHTIGHEVEVETFVTRSAVPEKIWLKSTPIHIERREYKTKNELVPAEFEIDLLVELPTLARFEQLIQDYRQTRPNDTSDGANEAIRSAIAESAIRAASRVMSQIEPIKYFSEYERWEAAGDESVGPEPNYVRDQLVRAIAAELKSEFGVERCRVNPRPVDRRVALILKAIQQIGDIDLKVVVEPRDSRGPHEALEVRINYRIATLDLDSVAQVIQRGDNPLPRASIEKDLKDWSFEALNARPREELYGLVAIDPASRMTKMQIEQHVGGSMKFHYGVIVDIKTISLGRSEVDDAERIYNALPTREIAGQLASYQRALAEAAAPSDEEADRKFLRARLEVLQNLIRDNPREDIDDQRRLERHQEELDEIKRQLVASKKSILATPRLQLEVARNARPPESEPAGAPPQDVTPPRDTGL
jgi:hypothetical protein